MLFPSLGLLSRFTIVWKIKQISTFFHGFNALLISIKSLYFEFMTFENITKY